MAQWHEDNGTWQVVGVFGEIRIAPDTSPTTWPRAGGRLRAVASGVIEVVDCTAGGVWWPEHHTHDDLRTLMWRCAGSVDGVVQWDGQTAVIGLASAYRNSLGWHFELVSLRPPTLGVCTGLRP